MLQDSFLAECFYFLTDLTNLTEGCIAKGS